MRSPRKPPPPSRADPAVAARQDSSHFVISGKENIMTWLLTGYVLMWPVTVLGVLIAITRGFFRDLKEADRKSTRLNSSHVAISYAVFCLKKNTTTKNATTGIIR